MGFFSAFVFIMLIIESYKSRGVEIYLLAKSLICEVPRPPQIGVCRAKVDHGDGVSGPK